ncbi:ankyrin repeat domain-containing protein [bacterium]|nr:MAG: ankyrin repeat domain-containing protein [bacterium]
MKLKGWMRSLGLAVVDPARNNWNECGWVSPLSEACIRSNPLLVRWLLVVRADPDGNPEESRRPIEHLAVGDCSAQALACARLLMAAGVDPRQFDDQALSALDYAEREGKEEMVVVLCGVTRR